MHNKNGMRVFDVNTSYGDFRVVDYSYNPLDREIYWARDTQRVTKGSKEYDVAETITNGYIQGIYEKLKPASRKNWPLV